MPIDVTVPPVGESITEGVLAEWLKHDGDVVALDDPLFTLETDKITMTVNATAPGRLTIAVAAGETVKIGQSVGAIDPAAAAEAPAPKRPTGPPAPLRPPDGGQPASPPRAPLPVPAVAQQPGPPLATPAGLPQLHSKLAGIEGLSPATRRVVQELGLDPTSVPGTGKDGRITKEDALRHAASPIPPSFAVATPSSPSPPPATAPPQPPATLQPPDATRSPPAAPVPPSPAATSPPTPTPPVEPEVQAAAPRQTRTKMSPLRQRIAERLVQAKNATAMLTTFNEVDMTNVMTLRAAHREAYKAKHGVDLGYMSFFVKACVDALKAVPQLNAQILGDELIQNHYYDIGIAVSTERGLVVPVLRDADKLSMSAIEKQIADLARRTRDRTIALAELSGGVFTITNGGIFGSLLSTPIVNPPQAGILGMHAIKKRPVVVDDQIVVRPMMYLAMSYDHRIVDGREAVTFLKRIVTAIENPGFLLLEI
jgi:2-oxoglutarate dehydrogenase E2 component (dihydrolipoamide succinyltransferase)